MDRSKSLKIISRRIEDHDQQTDSAGGKPVREVPGLGLADLPDSSVASILRLTTPRDVARLACVSSAFRDTSSSDEVWEKMLPPHFTTFLAQDPNAPPSSCSKKEVYDYLSKRVFLENGTQKVWLDQSTAGICQAIGARGLQTIRFGYRRYYRRNRCTPEGSRFSQADYILEMDCFRVAGKLQLSDYLPQGIYSLSWRLFIPFGFTWDRFREPSRNSLGQYNKFGANYIPLKFSFKATYNEWVHRETYLFTDRAIDRNVMGRDRNWMELDRNLLQQGVSSCKEKGEELPPLLIRYRSKRWIEIKVGEFTVRTEHSPVELEFAMAENEGPGNRRSAMFSDGVIIRPSFMVSPEALLP